MIRRTQDTLRPYHHKVPLQTQMRHTRTRTCKEIRALHRACPSRLHVREMTMVVMMIVMPLLLLLLESTGRILAHRFPFGIILLAFFSTFVVVIVLIVLVVLVGIVLLVLLVPILGRTVMRPRP